MLAIFLCYISSNQRFAFLRGARWETSLEEKETHFDSLNITYLTINFLAESKEPEDKCTLYISGCLITKLTVNEPCCVVVRGPSIGCIVLCKGASLDVNNDLVVSMVRQC